MNSWSQYRSPLGMAKDDFDYESKVWGAHEVRVSPTYLGALRLQYCLKDLDGVSGKVLEVGCGAGGMARAIKHYRPDLDVYGCDISSKAIQAARVRPSAVTFDDGDVYELPYEAGSYEAVVMFDVLEHLDDPGRALAEIHRVLEAGGLFHLFVPCEGALYTLHGLLATLGWRAKEVYGGHIQRFTPSRVKEMLSHEGFLFARSHWSGHFINQAVDATYFTALRLWGRNVSTSVEGYLEARDEGLWRGALEIVKTGISVATYYESKLLSRIPGFGLHILCRKSKAV